VPKSAHAKTNNAKETLLIGKRTEAKRSPKPVRTGDYCPEVS
jgi:hypothetical protein